MDERRDCLEYLADLTAERIRQQLAPKLDDADIAVIKAAILSDLSQLREAFHSIGWALVKTHQTEFDSP